MMFSSHIDMIYKNSALQDIFVKLLFIEYRLSKKIPLHEKVMSEYISTNSGIHHQFRIYYKGGKVSQLWVSFCSAQSIQWVASGKKSAFLLLPLLS